MSNKENDLKEKFKHALVSTAKVISDDYKIDLKKYNKNIDSKKLDFFDKTNLSSKSDFVRWRRILGRHVHRATHSRSIPVFWNLSNAVRMV